MGQVRHGFVTATHAVRAAAHRLRALLATHSREPRINPKPFLAYRMLKLPAVPTATDIGLLWPRRSLKRSWVATSRYGTPRPAPRE